MSKTIFEFLGLKTVFDIQFQMNQDHVRYELNQPVPKNHIVQIVIKRKYTKKGQHEQKK